MITRYNQGFFKFGPLEQCNDGELVKFADHVAEVDSIIEEIVDENDGTIYELMNTNYDLMSTNLDYSFGLTMSISLNCVLGLILIAKYFA